MVNHFFHKINYNHGLADFQVEYLHIERKCNNDIKLLCSRCVFYEIRTYLGHCNPFICTKKQEDNDKKIDSIHSHIMCSEQNNKDFHYLDDCNECKEKIKELIDDNINIIEQYLSADDDRERIQEKKYFDTAYDVLNRKRMSSVKSARSRVD